LASREFPKSIEEKKALSHHHQPTLATNANERLPNFDHPTFIRDSVSQQQNRSDDARTAELLFQRGQGPRTTNLTSSFASSDPKRFEQIPKTGGRYVDPSLLQDRLNAAECFGRSGGNQISDRSTAKLTGNIISERQAPQEGSLKSAADSKPSNFDNDSRLAFFTNVDKSKSQQQQQQPTGQTAQQHSGQRLPGQSTNQSLPVRSLTLNQLFAASGVQAQPQGPTSLTNFSQPPPITSNQPPPFIPSQPPPFTLTQPPPFIPSQPPPFSSTQPPPFTPNNPPTMTQQISTEPPYPGTTGVFLPQIVPPPFIGTRPTSTTQQIQSTNPTLQLQPPIQRPVTMAKEAPYSISTGYSKPPGLQHSPSPFAATQSATVSQELYSKQLKVSGLTTIPVKHFGSEGNLADIPLPDHHPKSAIVPNTSAKSSQKSAQNIITIDDDIEVLEMHTDKSAKSSSNVRSFTGPTPLTNPMSSSSKSVSPTPSGLRQSQQLETQIELNPERPESSLAFRLSQLSSVPKKETDASLLAKIKNKTVLSGTICEYIDSLTGILELSEIEPSQKLAVPISGKIQYIFPTVQPGKVRLG
jgi:hypothetical protein